MTYATDKPWLKANSQLGKHMTKAKDLEPGYEFTWNDEEYRVTANDPDTERGKGRRISAYIIARPRTGPAIFWCDDDDETLL